MFDLLSHVFATARAPFVIYLLAKNFATVLLLELISFLPASDATFLLGFVLLG